MKIIRKKELTVSEKKRLLEIWNNEYPKSISYPDIESFEKYFSEFSDIIFLLLIDNEERINGFYYDFIRDGERWFAMLLDSSVHGNGYGTMLLNAAKKENNILNGWVVEKSNFKKQNGDFYRSPGVFYLKNGFKLLQNSRLENEKLSAVKIVWENI
jgi:GNAT superfamily N-acetyltransferase